MAYNNSVTDSVNSGSGRELEIPEADEISSDGSASATQEHYRGSCTHMKCG